MPRFPKVGVCSFRKLSEPILDQGAVRDEDDVALTHPFGAIHQLVVVVEHQPLVGVGTGERRVEAAQLFANGDAQGSEAFHAGAVEDLQPSVGHHANRDGGRVVIR